MLQKIAITDLPGTPGKAMEPACGRQAEPFEGQA